MFTATTSVATQARTGAAGSAFDPEGEHEDGEDLDQADEGVNCEAGEGARLRRYVRPASRQARTMRSSSTCSREIMPKADEKMMPVATMLPKIGSLRRQKRKAKRSPAASGAVAIIQSNTS